MTEAGDIRGEIIILYRLVGIPLVHRKISSPPTILRAEGFLAYVATDIGLSSIASTPPEVASPYPSPSPM